MLPETKRVNRAPSLLQRERTGCINELQLTSTKGMRKPIFVRPISDAERETLEAGLRSSDAFVLRRCQILLASERGENAYQIARSLGCDSQTVRNAIHRFNEEDHLETTLAQGSSRPHTVHAAFDSERAEKLKELLHRSPREFGKPSSLWTLDMAAEVSFEEGLTEKEVSGETIRATLERIGVRWRRAKRWITSPDPGYERKKGVATG
jgi:transposase